MNSPDSSTDGTEQDNKDNCSIVGCEREVKTTALFSTTRLIPYDSSPALIRSLGDACAIGACLPCRRTLAFGNSVNSFVDEWESEQQKQKFIEKSQAIYKPIDGESNE